MLLINGNSSARGEVNRIAINLPRVPQRRKLTTEEEADAQRLRQVWERQRKALRLTQQEVALECGWSTQAAFGHYLRGLQPLNFSAAFKIAGILKVDIAEISPRLAKQMPQRGLSAAAEESSPYQPTTSKQNQKRLAWMRLFDQLERVGLAETALRLLRPLVIKFRRGGGRPPRSNDHRVKKRK